MTSVRDQIEALLRKARVERDEPTRNVIGMIKNKVLVALKSGSGVQEDDKLWADTVQAYAKEVQKAIRAYEEVGEQGGDAAGGGALRAGVLRAVLAEAAGRGGDCGAAAGFGDGALDHGPEAGWQVGRLADEDAPRGGGPGDREEGSGGDLRRLTCASRGDFFARWGRRA
jgi:hypothetical protein